MHILLYSLVLINVALILIIYKLFLLYEPSYMYENTNYYKYKFSYLDECIDSMETGDILLFSAYEFSAIRIISSCRFSHVAMIVKKDFEVYGVDMLDNDYVAPGKTKEDIYIFDIRERILYYSGFVYLCKCNKIISIDNKKSVEDSVFSSGITYPDRKILMYKYFLNKRSHVYDNYKSCVEYVAHLMKIGNICDITNNKISEYMHNILLRCDGRLYSKPIRMIVRDLSKDEYASNKQRKDLCLI